MCYLLLLLPAEYLLLQYKWIQFFLFSRLILFSSFIWCLDFLFFLLGTDPLLTFRITSRIIVFSLLVSFFFFLKWVAIIVWGRLLWFISIYFSGKQRSYKLSTMVTWVFLLKISTVIKNWLFDTIFEWHQYTKLIRLIDWDLIKIISKKKIIISKLCHTNFLALFPVFLTKIALKTHARLPSQRNQECPLPQR